MMNYIIALLFYKADSKDFKKAFIYKWFKIASIGKII